MSSIEPKTGQLFAVRGSSDIYRWCSDEVFHPGGCIGACGWAILALVPDDEIPYIPHTPEQFYRTAPGPKRRQAVELASVDPNGYIPEHWDW